MRKTRTPRRAMTSVRRIVAVAAVAAGVGVAAAPRAHAELQVVFGDVYCHATAAGPPRYFHSGVAGAAASVSGGRRNAWSSLDAAGRRRLERLTLDDLAAEFARHVAERHAVDTLLASHCDLTPVDAADAEIAAAAYFRAGAPVPYPSAGKVAVAWRPDFKRVVERHAWAVATPAAEQ